MSSPEAFDRVKRNLDRLLESGQISEEQYQEEMGHLAEDYQRAAEEAAFDAYMAEKERW